MNLIKFSKQPPRRGHLEEAVYAFALFKHNIANKEYLPLLWIKNYDYSESDSNSDSDSDSNLVVMNLGIFILFILYLHSSK